MATLPVESWVAVPFDSVNGQLTPPWLTRPLADQLSVDPEIDPVPAPFTLIVPPQIAVNDTVPLDELTGVTVYWTLPQPVAGVDALTDDHVPAKASIPTVGDGDVEVRTRTRPSWRSRSEQLAATTHAQATTENTPNSPHRASRIGTATGSSTDVSAAVARLHMGRVAN